MSLFQAFILGTIQGLTEFLPISSSGHLILVPKLFNWQLQSLTFDAIIHLGTLAAVIFYFRRDVWELVRSFIFYKNSVFASTRKMALLLFIGILPAGIVGVFLDDFIESAFRSTNIVLFNMVFWGFFLIVADWYGNKKDFKSTKDLKSSHPIKALLIGIFQIFSLIPGTSRSGITIGTGIFAGLTKQESARFSFLMSIPLILGAGLFESLKLLQTQGDTAISLFPIITGFLSSAFVGFLAITFLMKVINSFGLTFFGLYRILLAIVVLMVV